jgi:hypothetical protein
LIMLCLFVKGIICSYTHCDVTCFRGIIEFGAFVF